MNPALVVFLSCLLVLSAQGQPANRSSKCKCLNGFIRGKMDPRLIKAEPEIYKPSVFCPHTEIIVTLTGDKKKCVDPQSRLGNLILKTMNKLARKGDVSTTTTTTTMATATASTSLHSTSNM